MFTSKMLWVEGWGFRGLGTVWSSHLFGESWSSRAERVCRYPTTSGVSV